MSCYQVHITLGISRYLSERYRCYRLRTPLPHLLGGGREDCRGGGGRAVGILTLQPPSSYWAVPVVTVRFDVLLRRVLEKRWCACGNGLSSTFEQFWQLLTLKRRSWKKLETLESNEIFRILEIINRVESNFSFFFFNGNREENKGVFISWFLI